MKEIGEGDGDDVDIVTREQLFVIRFERRDVVGLGCLASTLRRNLRQRNDARGGMLLERTDVIVADATRTDFFLGMTKD